MSAVRKLPIETLSLHPLAHLVPEMPPEQYRPFAADVKERGIIEPLKLKPGSRIVLDGRTRLRAGRDAGLGEVPVEDAVLDENDPDGTLYMLRLAYLRRHLTRDQLTALAADLEEKFAAAAKARMQDGAAKGGQTAGRGRPKNNPVADPPQGKPPSAPKSRELAAAATGVNPRAVSDAKLVKQKAPALHEQVKAGTKKLADAVKEVKGDKPTPTKSNQATSGSAESPNASPGTVMLVPVEPGSMSPCPFCGSTTIAHRVLVGGSRAFVCEDCQARGPAHAEAEVARAAWNKRQPAELKPVTSSPAATGLGLVGGFPDSILKQCVHFGLATTADVVRAAEALDPKLSEEVRIYAIFRRVPKVSPELAARALDAILGATMRLHTRLTTTELERAAFPNAIYGWCIRYSTNRGDERECHFVGNEATALRKAKLKTGFKAVVKAEPLTEQNYVRAYGRGRT